MTSRPDSEETVVSRRELFQAYCEMRWGGYSKKSALGSGFYGSSFIVTQDDSLRLQYRLKTFSLRSVYRANPESLAAALTPIQSNISPHLTPIISVISDPLNSAVVFPFFPTGSLEQIVLSSREITLERQLIWLLRIASAMKALHVSGLLHGSLHPRNVLLSRDFDCFVTDYSLSLIAELSSPAPSLYLAPELESPGSQFTQESDVFSFGMLAFFIFVRKNLSTRHRQHLIDGQRPEIPKNCPHQVRRLISHCWTQDPKLRPSFQRIIEQLALLGSESPHTLSAMIAIEPEIVPRAVMTDARKEAGVAKGRIAELFGLIDEQNRIIASKPAGWNTLDNQLEEISAKVEAVRKTVDSLGSFAELDRIQRRIDECTNRADELAKKTGH
jgi:serine/threonine protein kinase